MFDPFFSSEHEQNTSTPRDLIPEELAEQNEERVKSAMATVSDIETDMTKNISDIIEEILAMEEDEEMPQITPEDLLCAAMAVLRPMLKQMAFDERKQVCDEMAENIRKARFVTDAKICIGREDRREPESSGELGRRIMAKRNPHYRFYSE